MKTNLFVSLAIFSTTLFFSCGKKKSADLPLPKDRVEAVYITTENNNIISYNPYTGGKQWEVILKGSSEGTPVLYNKKLYVLTNQSEIYSIEILTGEIFKQKTVAIPGNQCNKSMAIVNGKIYIAADSIYCYDTTFSKLFTYGNSNGNPCTSSPQVLNDKVYFGNGDICACISSSSGSSIWNSASIGTTIESSPTVSNGVVYFGGNDKKVHAVNESDGSTKWDYTTLDEVHSSPIVYGGMCIVGSQDFGIYCIDTTSGLLRWVYNTTERVASSPCVHEASNTVLVGSYDFNLYAIDHVSGTLKWKYPAGSLIKSSPVVYGNYVYFTSFDRYLYCVDVRDGSTVWKSFLNGNSLSAPIVDDLKKGIFPSISGMSKY